MEQRLKQRWNCFSFVIICMSACYFIAVICTANAGGFGQSDWTAPIGIPNPGFGITAPSPPDSPIDPNAYNPARDYWIDNSHPNCTDSGNPRGSPNRPRRTLPKNLTLLQEGTIVQIRGGITQPYEINDIGTPDDNTSNDGIIRVSGHGTAGSPIWIRGPRNGPYPKIRSTSPSTYWTWVRDICAGIDSWKSRSNPKFSMFKIIPNKFSPTETKPTGYIYFENLDLENVRFDIEGETTASDSTMGVHHLMLRRIHGHDTPAPTANLQPPPTAPTHLYENTYIGAFIRMNRCSNILIYDCDIYENGAYIRTRPTPEPDPFDFENDYYGILIGLGASNVWVVDNRMYRNSGDSIQVNISGALSGSTAWTSNPANANAHHIYIGRNEMYQERENAIDLKLCHHVVVSQNKIYSLKSQGSSGGGTAIVLHSVPVSTDCVGNPLPFYPYERRGPDSIWLLYNEIYDCERTGITISHASNEDTIPNDIYVVGNLLYNIKHRYTDVNQDGQDDWFPAPGSDGTAILAKAIGRVYIYNNTLYNCDLGVALTGLDLNDLQGYRLDIANNIISKMSSHESYFHVGFFNLQSTMDAFVKNNLFYEPDGRAALFYVREYPLPADYYHIPKFELILDSGGNKGDNLWANPLFVNPTSDPLLRDFRLHPGSPAIDSGLNLGYQELFSSPRYFSNIGVLLQEDFIRNPRPSGNSFDRGAYEFAQNP